MHSSFEVLIEALNVYAGAAGSIASEIEAMSKENPRLAVLGRIKEMLVKDTEQEGAHASSLASELKGIPRSDLKGQRLLGVFKEEKALLTASLEYYRSQIELVRQTLKIRDLGSIPLTLFDEEIKQIEKAQDSINRNVQT